MAVKALIFDLDDTLIDDETSYATSMSRLCDDFGFDIERVQPAYDALSPRFWGAGDLSAQREVLWRRALQDAGYDPALAAAVRDRYLSLRIETSIPLDGTEAVISDLREAYRLAVVTNGGGDVQSRRLAHAGLAAYFDALVCSSDVDAGKPDARIFEHALGEVSAGADEAWVIGDHLSSDIAGALSIGATAVWFNARGQLRRPDHPEPHHEITALDELRGLLP